MTNEVETPTRRPRRFRTTLCVCGSIGFLALLLFTWNGVDPGWRTPEFEVLPTPATEAPELLRVLSFNIAKARFHRGAVQFASREEVEGRLDKIASLITSSDAHLVLLSEVVWESGPVPLNQVRYLAERTDMHALAYGDNYRFGFPFFRIRAGNAVLSKFPLQPRFVQQLAGGGSFIEPTGNRRALWCELRLGDRSLTLGSIRNDSFFLENNEVQASELLATIGSEPALLAGDFNAEPEDPSMKLFWNSGRFHAVPHDQSTFPSSKPERQIDYVLAPARWEFVGQVVLESSLSDHLPVLATYRVR